MEPAILRVAAGTVHVGPVYRTPLVDAVLAVPGTRITQDAAGQEALVLPRNVWALDVVRALFDALKLPRPYWDAAPAAISTAIALRDYQLEAVRWLGWTGGGLLADALGLGKTRTAAAAALHFAAGSGRPIVIIGPRFLRRNWVEELRRIGALHDLETDLCALEGRELRLDLWKRDARFFYCHYDIVSAWWPWLWPLKPAAVIVDEAHYLKNSQAQRSRGVAAAVTMCPHRILLTATPLSNRVGELWNLLNLVEGRWSFGTPREFRLRYAGAYHDGYGLRDGSPSRVDELRTRLELCYLRRTVDEVRLELPPLTRQPIYVSLTESERALYAHHLDGHSPDAICDALLERRCSTETLRMLMALRKLVSRWKYPATLARLVDHLHAGEDVVVFCWERKTAERFFETILKRAAESVPPSRLPQLCHGGLPQAARDSAVAAFQEHGGALFATFDALGVGVNLQRARVVLMHDLDWVPAKLLQAEGRVWRQGQTRPVVSEWVVADDTIDALFAEHLTEKGSITDTVLADASASTLATVFPQAGRFETQLKDRLDQWMVRS